MTEKKEQIKSFTSLQVWQHGHALVVDVYKTTKKFPKDELYSLTNQMRRSAASITSNIAEGFGRKSYKEKIQFYYISGGSLTELKNQILIARDVGYLDGPDFRRLAEESNATHRLLNGLINKSKTFLTSSI